MGCEQVGYGLQAPVWPRMSCPWRTVALAALGSFLSIGTPVSSVPLQTTADRVDFTADRWDLERATIVDHLGRKALMGTAFLKGVELDDGVIECDVAMKADVRAYPGVLFRVQSPGEYERVYLRPHRAPLYDDAVQYVAAFNGVDSWQRSNGPGRTASAVIPTGRWLHFRLQRRGRHLPERTTRIPRDQRLPVAGHVVSGHRRSVRRGEPAVAEGRQRSAVRDWRGERRLGADAPGRDGRRHGARRRTDVGHPGGLPGAGVRGVRPGHERVLRVQLRRVQPEPRRTARAISWCRTTRAGSCASRGTAG